MLALNLNEILRLPKKLLAGSEERRHNVNISFSFFTNYRSKALNYINITGIVGRSMSLCTYGFGHSPLILRRRQGHY